MAFVRADERTTHGCTCNPEDHVQGLRPGPAVASGVGIAVSQAFVNKYLAERFETLTGEPAPEKMRQVKIKA